MVKQHIRYGGRGSGRPQDWFKYGKRTCQYLADYRMRAEADKKARQLEKDGIMAVVRHWYGRWVVYRCGMRKLGR